MKYDLVVVGEVYIDHVLTGFGKWPEPGEEVYAEGYAVELGGGAAITACALARLGRSVSLIGLIGRAEQSWIQDRLADFGVSHEQLRTTTERTGTTVSVSSQIDRSFFTFLGANAHLEQQLGDESLMAHMAQARHVHFAMPVSAGIANKMLDKLGTARCTTSLDVGHHAAWLQDAVNLRTCSRIDYVLPNEREARIISNGGAEEYLNFTIAHRWPNGVIKMGVGGAMMRGRDGFLRAFPPKVETIDTTGAGDAFNAGFLDAFLEGKDGAECLRRGCVLGALSTRAAGALRALPKRDELEVCLKECYG